MTPAAIAWHREPGCPNNLTLPAATLTRPRGAQKWLGSVFELGLRDSLGVSAQVSAAPPRWEGRARQQGRESGLAFALLGPSAAVRAAAAPRRRRAPRLPPALAGRCAQDGPDGAPPPDAHAGEGAPQPPADAGFDAAFDAFPASEFPEGSFPSGDSAPEVDAPPPAGDAAESQALRGVAELVKRLPDLSWMLRVA